MNNILNSTFYRFLDKLTNFFFLNMMWLLCSLPIVTLFPATAAMLNVFKDWTENNEKNLFKSFFYYFKVHFKHSFIYGILWILSMIIFYLDLILINEFESYNFILTSLLFLLILIVIFNTVYFLPINIHFQLSFFNKIKNAFLFSIMFFPTTLLSILIGLIALGTVIFVPAVMFIIFSPAAYVVYRLCHRTFKKVDKLLKQL